MEFVIPEHNIGVRIDMNQCLLDIKSSMERILNKWEKLPTIGNGESDGISFCMLQMMACKLNSFVTIASHEGQQDIESLSAIARGVYEMAFIYHNMFITPESDKESEILLLLWKIRGFNNRIYSNDPYQRPEHKSRDQKEVERFCMRVQELIKELNISEKASKQILHALDKGTSKITGYQFVKDNAIITSFEPISFEKTSGLFKNKEKLVLYEMLSSHSHPSYLGVKHFDYMHNVDTTEIDRVKEYLIQSVCYCSAKFMMDVCQKVKNGSELRENILPQIRFYVDISNFM
ncbi:MAG: hypothetical protein J6T44_04960 [Prevotella sp.]|nr:hypothetical protein [Prevotella sp.]